jgi:hypothetical protein
MKIAATLGPKQEAEILRRLALANDPNTPKRTYLEVMASIDAALEKLN